MLIKLKASVMRHEILIHFKMDDNNHPGGGDHAYRKIFTARGSPSFVGL